jgi:hypothetical protein
MRKKLLLLTLIGTYFTFILFTPLTPAISSEISFEIDTEIEEPINPGDSKEISLKIKYKLNISDFAKRIYLKRRIGRMIAFGLGYIIKFRPLPKAKLNLSIDKPEWCEAELDNYEFEFTYNNKYEEKETKLTLTLNENATALQKSEIKIIADYLGIGTINPTSNSTTISFMPAFISDIFVEAELEHTIPPLKETLIPINITNNGNGEGIVNIQILDQEKWNITLDQDDIIIGVGEEKQVMMTVKPPKNFDNVTIHLTFEPLSIVEDVESSYRNGTNVDFGITFYNDGSLKEEDELDLTMILIIGFIIIIALIIVVLIFKKKE